MLKTNNYLFSIVVPTYNRRVDLERCLNSLAKQTFKNFEVIICDNGSTDDTKDLVFKYEKLLNLNYIYINENSGGPAFPRNLGIKAATGDWICFLDSDDWYSENRLEYISNLNLDGIDFIYHNLNIIRNGQIAGAIKSRDLSRKDAYHDLLYNLNAIPTSSTCIRRVLFEKTGGFKDVKEINGLEDFDLWIRFAAVGVNFKYIPLVLGSYVFGDDNLTYQDERQINRFIAVYKDYIESQSDKHKKNKIKAALDYNIGWIHIKNKNLSIGFPFLNSALKKGSFAIKLRAINLMMKGIKQALKK